MTRRVRKLGCASRTQSEIAFTLITFALLSTLSPFTTKSCATVRDKLAIHSPWVDERLKPHVHLIFVHCW